MRIFLTGMAFLAGVFSSVFWYVPGGDAKAATGVAFGLGLTAAALTWRIIDYFQTRAEQRQQRARSGGLPL